MADTTLAPRVLQANKKLLGKNAALAQANRDRFRSLGILALNLLSSPGAGKTALLERLLADRAGVWRMGVVVGDLATDNDARRLARHGPAVVQIETGTACHLEADMVADAVQGLDLERLDLLAIENVGNLVCPAGYDLGESLRVVLASVTEGEDKPLKYPTAFRSADLVLVTKIDLTEATGADVDLLEANVRTAAPRARVLRVSARTGAGLAEWHAELERRLADVRAGR